MVVFRNFGRKQDNATWIGEDENVNLVVRHCEFEPKIMDIAYSLHQQICLD